MKKAEWKKLYINRLMSKGLSKKEAKENHKAIDNIESMFAYEIDPKEAADEEFSYMMEESR